MIEKEHGKNKNDMKKKKERKRGLGAQTYRTACRVGKIESLKL